MKYLLLIGLFFGSCFLADAQCADNGNYWNKSWVSCTETANPNTARPISHWVLYEFDGTYHINETTIWNANRTGESGWGAKDVIIDYSPDGTTWVEVEQTQFPQANEASDYEGFAGPVLNGQGVQKILFTILNTHDGGSCASIAEVQFKLTECKLNLTVDNNNYPMANYEAGNLLDTDGTVSVGASETTIFKATEIILNPDFEVQSNGLFEVINEPCTP